MNGEVKNAFGVLEGMQIKKPDTLWQLQDKSVIPFPLKKTRRA